MARSAILNVMVNAADKAGRGLARDFGEVENLQVSRKGPADFVSRADMRAEEVIRTELQRARPNFGFVGEEGTLDEGDGQHRFIVDPLDGTTNFLHGLPLFAVSIGLERQGELIAGVVYNPVMDELFVAERGQGAFLNNRRLRVSARTDLADCLIGTGLPFMGQGNQVRALAELQPLMSRIAGIRRMGSASLDLAGVAAGRLDGFWEHELKPWDIAAGIVIIREAGGFVTDADNRGDMMKNGTIIAGNEAVHRALLRNVKEAQGVGPRSKADASPAT